MKNQVRLFIVLVSLIAISVPGQTQTKAKRILKNMGDDLKDAGRQTVELTKEGLQRSVRELPNAGRDAYQMGKYIIKTERNPISLPANTREIIKYNDQRNQEREKTSREARQGTQEISRKYRDTRDARWRNLRDN